MSARPDPVAGLQALPDDPARRDGAVTRFREALAEIRAGIARSFEAGAPARTLVARQARLVDRVLVRAWDLHRDRLPEHEHVALVAVGGYGRGELHPFSDVDVMVLVRDQRYEAVQDFSERLFRFLWDVGLEIGHSVRTVNDCVRQARADITIATNLMEARLLCGESPLFEQMQRRTGPDRIWPPREFFEAKLSEQLARHQRFDDTGYNLEPNLKEGPGGLRDIQMIGWVTHRHFGSAGLKELVHHDFLSEDEYRTLIRGRNFLWKLRIGLHLLAGRREDRLLFDHQRALATRFGYEDGPDKLAVEHLMKRYYRTVKELHLLNEILLQHFQEEILAPRRERKRPINERFQAHGTFLETVRDDVFEDHPPAMLELFLVLQQNQELEGVRAHTIRRLRECLHLVDRRFRADPRCRALFTEILRQPEGVTHALRRMNAYGVLGAYIPAFGRVVGQMQHDLFHVYTVDAHSLFVVRNLRRLALSRFRDELPAASEIMAPLAKKERLYLAGLFHDIAKGRGGDHSLLGERDALAFCRQHLSDYDAHFVAWLVRHHLLMSFTAQREDITSPEVVQRFARTVGDQEHLDNLYVFTIADIRGTNPGVWTAWKGSLLAELYSATTRALRRGFGAPIQVEERIRDLKGEVLAALDGDHTLRKATEKHWRMLDDDYFLRHDADTIAWHARRVVDTRAIDLPLVAARYNPAYGGNQVLVFAPESERLFSVVAGGFDRLNLNIVDARIHSTDAGFALYGFIALDHNGNAIEDAGDLAGLEGQLRERILRPEGGRDPRRVRLARTLKHFPIEPQVSFAASMSGQQTIMEVTAQDRPGLLYQVALAMLHCKVRLVTAKVATFGERVEDVFFITDRDGQPVDDEAQRRCLDSRITKVLGSGGDGAARRAAD